MKITLHFLQDGPVLFQDALQCSGMGGFDIGLIIYQ